MSDNIHFLPRNPQRPGSETSIARPNSLKSRVANNNVIPLSAETGTKDSIAITNAGRELQNLNQLGKNSSGVDLNKIDRIKQALADGDYQVNNDSVAKNMIEIGAIINLLTSEAAE